MLRGHLAGTRISKYSNPLELTKMLKYGRQLLIRLSVLTAVAGTLVLGACGGTSDQAASADSSAASPVVVYSAVEEQLVKSVFDAYTAETGIPVNYVIDSGPALVRKLTAEGEATAADLLLTVDAVNLWNAAEEDELRPAYSDVLNSNIPSHLRDAENQWFALTVHARTIVYDTRKVDPSELAGYAGLADDKWEGKLCLSTSENVYNQSHIAMMIARMGERETEILVRGWVGNLATSVFPDDTSVLEAIESGQCQVGIVNTNDFGRLQRENVDTPVSIYWPSLEAGGVHIDVSGAGITRHARNPDGARALLEWLSGDAGQRHLVGEGPAYPANPNVQAAARLEGWGEFDASPMNVSQAGVFQEDALKLMERANYR